LLELSHFLLPRQHSFLGFVHSTVFEPFPELKSTVSPSISEFFELESDDSKDDDHSFQSKNEDKSIVLSKLVPSEEKERLKPFIQNREPNAQVTEDQTETKRINPNNQGFADNSNPPKVSSQNLSQDKLLMVSSIPITTQYSRNPLVSRHKYVGNHFSQNAAALLNQVQMGPLPDKRKFAENRIIKETPVKDLKRAKTDSSRSPSRKIKEISPCVVRKKDPSNLVAAVMKLHSKSR
jgi:hypothetical protein